MKTIYFITGNRGKLLEAKEKLSAAGVDVLQKNIGYPEIQADNLEDVAAFGVEYLREKTNHPFIIEDAGLFINVLNGFPGVYSAYVYYTIGLDGILKLLKDVDHKEREATFKSVFAFSTPGEKTMFFKGECRGYISFEKKGRHGFGYDPIFVPLGKNKTFAEMETKEKNKYSHRGCSLQKLLDFLKK